jgi:hypothetical protein
MPGGPQGEGKTGEISRNCGGSAWNPVFAGLLGLNAGLLGLNKALFSRFGGASARRCRTAP